ncbi:MAG: LarC family nickel insertion protein [Alphaproteobacteria bacterium]|nr:LarC family nickel insertion protein [Alphaproteobacteria bacterium]
MKHLHLDPLGGVAGDMFVAALLDAFPEHENGVIAAAEQAAAVHCQIVPHHDVFAGRRFCVRDDRGGHDGNAHDHVAWRDIRARIAATALPDAVKTHAIGIFELLAEAEGRVHGIEPEAATFHEVGAADSIADIVAAGWLIAALAPARWSVAALPLGAGRVRTAHGPMPVPAPATALLLEGFVFLDDGIAGERVTPTGAAILRYLNCAPSPPGAAGRLERSGVGFGSRKLPGMANALRVLAFATEGGAALPAHRALAVVEFEIDDQSGEDLAAGLDRLRSFAGVHDVVQMAAFGKKGRLATHVQILARPDALAAVTEACFRETTTIGLRTHLVDGLVLPRRQAQVAVGERSVRVKLVDRPGGVSGKAECDDAADLEGHAARVRLRRDAEQRAEAEFSPALPETSAT